MTQFGNGLKQNQAFVFLSLVEICWSSINFQKKTPALKQLSCLPQITMFNSYKTGANVKINFSKKADTTKNRKKKKRKLKFTGAFQQEQRPSLR